MNVLNCTLIVVNMQHYLNTLTVLNNKELISAQL